MVSEMLMIRTKLEACMYASNAIVEKLQESSVRGILGMVYYKSYQAFLELGKVKVRRT